MTAPAIFSFENIQVRTLGTSEFPLFVANDIAKALGYQNLVRTVNDRVDPEDLFKSEIETNGGRQLVNCVNESGLYALIFGSKLESAKRFKRWVTSEIVGTSAATLSAPKFNSLSSQIATLIDGKGFFTKTLTVDGYHYEFRRDEVFGNELTVKKLP